MSSIALDSLNVLTGLENRNLQATLKINQFAALHGSMDAFIGGAGSIVPGMGPVAIVSALSLQLPVYQALVVELGRIYSAPWDRTTTGIVVENAVLGANAMIAAELIQQGGSEIVNELVQQFGLDFFREILPGILGESAAGLLASMIPVVGIAAGATIDFAIAATMTWRVGTMTSIYFQNGNSWVVNRRNTYQISKRLSKRVSTNAENRVDLNDISRNVPEVAENHIQAVMIIMKSLRKRDADMTDAEVRENLSSQGFPKAVIDAGLRRLNGR